MNWLLILTILYLAWCLVWGWHKGLLMVAYSLSAWLIAILLVTYATPYLTDYVIRYTSIDDRLEVSVRERLQGLVLPEDEAADGVSREAADAREADDASQAAADDVALSPEQERVNEEVSAFGIQLPQLFSGQVFDANALADQALTGSGIYDALAARITYTVIHGVIYVLVLVGTVVLLKVLGVVLKIVSRIEGIREVNQTAGLAAGAVKGMLIICIFYMVVALIAATEIGKLLTGAVYGSPVLTWIYEHNPLLSLLGNVMKNPVL